MINRNLELGCNVIVRSNEDDPYVTGVFLGYDNSWHDPNREQYPVVGINGTRYICMGIVIEDNQELRGKLDLMTPKEQWNYLSEHYKRD